MKRADVKVGDIVLHNSKRFYVHDVYDARGTIPHVNGWYVDDDDQYIDHEHGGGRDTIACKDVEPSS
jgi:hypothetical protein